MSRHLMYKCSAFHMNPQVTLIRSLVQSISMYSGGSNEAPPYDPHFSYFYAVFKKFWQNRMLASPFPLREWAPSPTGNAGSAPNVDLDLKCVRLLRVILLLFQFP